MHYKPWQEREVKEEMGVQSHIYTNGKTKTLSCCHASGRVLSTTCVYSCTLDGYKSYIFRGLWAKFQLI